MPANTAVIYGEHCFSRLRVNNLLVNWFHFSLHLFPQLPILPIVNYRQL